MEDVVTKELIDYYKKVTEYLKQLDGKKAEVEKIWILMMLLKRLVKKKI